MSTRYKLTVEYDGSGFVGWQRQENGLSVQQVLEEAAERFCGHAVRLHVAGRTDAGVHALAQVAHLDLERSFDEKTVRDAINFHVRPHGVAVLRVERMPGDETGFSFHARYSATARAYLYRILNRPAPPVLERQRVWWVARPLDHEAMDAAAKGILGRHDFSSFRASQCQAESPLRTLDRLDVTRAGEHIVIHAGARSFLHNQVRIMVGSLALIGQGKWPVSMLAQVLAARNRKMAGPTAPPDGLYLAGVSYPDLAQDAETGHTGTGDILESQNP